LRKYILILQRMSKESVKRRRFKIRQKQKRREKIKKLIKKYLEARDEEEKKKIKEKIFRISPHYPFEEALERFKGSFKT
jgi:hypothetical protein